MSSIKAILANKGSSVWSIRPTDTIQDALREMTSHNIGAVLVLDGAKLAGVFSERDLARLAAKSGTLDVKQPIAKVMTKKVFFAEPEHSVEECMKLMTSKHIRHMPVMEKGRVVGVISINDLVREIIADRETTIKSLENYLIGQSNIG